jgi:integrase
MDSSKRIKTKFAGVFYRESKTNGKTDKTYYIRFKDTNQQTREHKVGKFSEGVRENYCYQKRLEIVNKFRLGEEPPLLKRYKKSSKLLFSELADFYFEHKKSHWSQLNLQKSMSTYNLHIKPFFEGVAAEEVDKQLLLKLQSQKMDSGRSAKTVNNIMAMVMAIFHFALEHEKITMVIPTIKKFSVDNTRERFLSVEEIQKLYERVYENRTLFLFCKLALTTGARLSSILNIQKKDIDFNNAQINVKDYKNNSTYKAFISQELLEHLVSYTQDMKATSFVVGGKLTALTDTTITKPLRVVFDELYNAGLNMDDRKNRVVTHTLRHTFASHLAINATPIYTIQKLMNHKDIKMTLRYAKLSPDSGKTSVEALYQH